MGKKKNRNKKAVGASDNQSSPSTETSSQLSSEHAEAKLEQVTEEFYDACSIATTVEEEAPRAVAHEPVVAEEIIEVPVVEQEPIVKEDLTIESGPDDQSQEQHEVEQIVEEEEETTNTEGKAPIESPALETNEPSDDFDDFVEADQTATAAPIVHNPN